LRFGLQAQRELPSFGLDGGSLTFLRAEAAGWEPAAFPSQLKRGTTVKTVTVQIDNSDNKLKQEEWALFIEQVNFAVNRLTAKVHFFGGSQFAARCQNVAWVAEIELGAIHELTAELKAIRTHFRQDSVAMTIGEASLV
jgi:hypothetical protein